MKGSLSFYSFVENRISKKTEATIEVTNKEDSMDLQKAECHEEWRSSPSVRELLWIFLQLLPLGGKYTTSLWRFYFRRILKDALSDAFFSENESFRKVNRRGRKGHFSERNSWTHGWKFRCTYILTTVMAEKVSQDRIAIWRSNPCEGKGVSLTQFMQL